MDALCLVELQAQMGSVLLAVYFMRQFQFSSYGCEGWTVKKAERQGIDAFELWHWRRLSEVPWTQGDPTSPF